MALWCIAILLAVYVAVLIIDRIEARAAARRASHDPVPIYRGHTELIPPRGSIG